MVFMPSSVDVVRSAAATAPGSMILMGEYAVLEGSRAVLMTLQHRLRVTVTPSATPFITSDRFGRYTAGETPKPPHAVLCGNVLDLFCKHYGLQRPALHIDIVSAISPTYGFGSSAALVAALVKSLHRYFRQHEEFGTMFTIGHRAILDTFGRGSGADLAASLADQPFVVFDPGAKEASSFGVPFTVQAVYTGYKTPTPEVLKQIRAEVPQKDWADITRKMTGCADRFIAAPSFDAVREYQGYMETLGVACPACREAVEAFSAQGVAAKISGSGRGDCVVGVAGSPVAVSVSPPLVFLSAQELRA
jgi:mevalonate kinase